MQENLETDLQNTPADAAPEPTKDIEQEIHDITKPKATGTLIKAWLAALTLVFGLSMLSGLYIIFSGGAGAPRPTIKAEGDGKVAAILKASKSPHGAAVIKIRGAVQEGGESGLSARSNASAIARRIRALADKKEVKALLLDINSPGGTVGAVQDIYDAVLYFKSKQKPVVALFRDVAASGGFYIGAAADRIIAQPGTMTGSIGVIMQAANFEGLFEKLGVKFIPVKSGRHKDMGSPYRPMTEEEAALLQEMIAETYQQFYQAVRTGRPNVDEATLQMYADGRIFTGARAKAIGLIDDLGGEEKAKEHLIALTGDKDLKLLTPKVDNFFDMLSFSAAGLDGKAALAAGVQDIASPKVSYLWVL